MTPKPGRPQDGNRLDLVTTLRRAVPWQQVRQKSGAAKVAIRPSDLSVKQFETRSDQLLIFLVDASGSAAATRLAEAKGAVETILSTAYARRDFVSLISFRDRHADMLLPPTRSIVQARNRLSALPGGGGTPLALGLKAAAELAQSAKGRGMTPTIILLTDGGANIALDGSPGRPQARSDAEQFAGLIRANGIRAMTIDISRRGDSHLQELAAKLGGTYLQLPNAAGTEIAKSVSLVLA